MGLTPFLLIFTPGHQKLASTPRLGSRANRVTPLRVGGVESWFAEVEANVRLLC